MDSFLSTSYTLNSSDSKKVQIGIEYVRSTDTFEPIIRLYGPKGCVIILELSNWVSFKDKVGESLTYLKTFSRAAEGEAVHGDGFKIVNKFYYGEKNIEISHEENSESATKYKGSYVLQLRSVENLMRVMPCIDTYLKHLNLILDNFQKIVNFLSEKICEKIVREKTDDVKDFITVRDLIKMDFELEEIDLEKFLIINCNFSKSELRHIFRSLYFIKTDYVCFNVNKMLNHNI